MQTSAKKVRLQLEADLKMDLSHRKEEIGKLIQAVIDEMDDEDEDEEDGEEEEDEEEEETPKKNGVKNGNDKAAGTDLFELNLKSRFVVLTWLRTSKLVSFCTREEPTREFQHVSF